MQRYLLLLGLAIASGNDARPPAEAAVGFAYSLIAPRVVTAGPPATSPATTTMQQLDRIRELTKETGWTQVQAATYLSTCQAATFSAMSRSQSERLVSELERFKREQAAASAAKAAKQVPADGGCANGSCGVRRQRR